MSSTNQPKYSRLADDIFRRVEDGKPACLACGSALRPRTRYTHGETEAAARSMVPEGCKVVRVKKSVLYGVDVSFIPDDVPWGDHVSAGYFCTQRCAVAFGVKYAQKLGYKPAVGQPDKIIRRPS